jgi:hypothetical protein
MSEKLRNDILYIQMVTGSKTLRDLLQLLVDEHYELLKLKNISKTPDACVSFAAVTTHYNGGKRKNTPFPFENPCASPLTTSTENEDGGS